MNDIIFFLMRSLNFQVKSFRLKMNNILYFKINVMYYINLFNIFF